MDCLDNYIGLRGCGTTTPTSGLYVNDLPGISLKQIVSLTNEEEKTYLELWDMIQRRGQNRFSLDVREQMGKAYKIKSINQGISVPAYSTGTGTAAITAEYGFTVEYNGQNIDYVPSPLSYIHIQKVDIYVDQTGTYNLNFIDIDNSYPLLAISQTLYNGQKNTVEVNHTFNNISRIFGGITLQAANNYTSIQAPAITGECCGALSRGAYYDGNTFVYGQETYGLCVTYTVGCSWDGLICLNKNIFSRAFWYLLGIEVLTEVIYSTKLNQFTTVNLQKAQDLRTEYQVEYMKALTQVAEGMNLDCDCCLECSGSVQLRETTQFY